MSTATTSAPALTREQRSWGISILLHALILSLSLLVTCSTESFIEDPVEIQFGGGGIPGLDAPFGETPQGDPDGGNREVEQDRPTTESPTTTPSSSQSQTQPTDRRSDETIPAQERTNESNEQSDVTDKPSSNSEDGGSRGTNDSDKRQGTEDGKGEEAAGGSGGGAIGVGGGNLGGRCWQISPAQASGTAARERGTVSVTLTVMWDGQVRVTGVSGGGALASQARSLASRAKACRVEPGTPPQTTTVTYTVR